MSNARYTNAFRAPRPPAPPDPDRLIVRTVRLSVADWEFLAAAAKANARDLAQTVRDCVREARALVELDADYSVLLPRQGWPS